MFKKIFLINFILLFITQLAIAEKINNIKVFGNKRISKESIIVFGDIDLNANYNSEDLDDILKNIYESKFFKEVNVDINNAILEIKVVENPIIENVIINGVKSKKLNEFIIDNINLNSRDSFTEILFLADLNLMKNILKSSGYYFSEITTTSTLNEKQNTINLTYDINLGKRAKITKLQFIGDKKVKDRKLKNIITSEESKFLEIYFSICLPKSGKN